MSAPYSDDLYSGSLSDEEDISHFLSPADGFHASSESSSSHPSQHGGGPQEVLPISANVPYVPNILVADPSLEQSDSKAREASRDSLSSAQARSPTPDPSDDAPLTGSPEPQHHHYQNHTRSSSDTSAHSAPYTASSISPRQSPRTGTLPTERTPFRFPVDAPPAYSPSPTSPTSSSQRNFAPVGYQTFPTMGRPEEEQRWLLASQPESMGGGINEPDTPRPAWMAQVRGRAPRRTAVKKLLLFALIIWIVGALVWTVVEVVTEIKNMKRRGPDKKTPSFEPTPSEDVIWHPGIICKRVENRLPHKKFSVDFSSDKSLRVVETIERERRDGTTPEVFGDIILRGVERDSDAGIDVEIITNDDDLHTKIEWDDVDQYLRIETPHGVRWTSALRPCIQIRVTIRVPSGAELQELRLGAIRLDVNIEGDLSLRADKTTTDLVSGDVVSKPGHKLESRTIQIHTISGDIRGSFPLYDVLELISTSGDIGVSVGLEEENKEDPRPANLKLGTVSGDIRIEEPLGDRDAIPPREYLTEISSYSGDIRGNMAISTKGSLSSTSGDVKVFILPVLDGASSSGKGCKDARLTTETVSGDQKIDIADPLWVRISTTSSPLWHTSPKGGIFPVLDGSVLFPESAPVLPLSGHGPAKDHVLGCLTSGHDSMSGTIDLHFPGAWEGKFRAESISGKISIKGDGVEINSGILPDFATVVGSKGDGNSGMKIGTVSGNIHVLIGKEK